MLADAGPVLVLGAALVVETLSERPLRPLEAVLAATAVLALALRRSHPVAVVAVVGTAVVALLASGPPLLATNLALLVAAGSGVVHARRRSAVTAVVGLAVVAWTGGFLLDDTPDLGSDAVSSAWIAVPLLVGGVMRRQASRTRAAEEESRAAAAVLRAERERIARELHDVVGHTLAVVVLHSRAGSAALRQGDETAAAEALAVVETMGRDALADVRRLVALEQTPADETAAPGLSQLDALVARVRRAGLPVVVGVAGDLTRLPPGVDAAAYRLVQEALTNVVKHAGPDAHVRVAVSVGGGAVELEVEDDGAGPPASEAGAMGAAAGGHGLVGMAERVGLYGGRFESGPRAPHGFRVRAELPLAPA
ncbi:hypothetical protein Cma02nite_28000 [Cellulomonas marina]|nr:hypothetical protein Cma02nite_28000 [Cellulomonas marina]